MESDLEHLTASEQKVAWRIPNHPHDVLDLTTRDLSSWSGSTQAAATHLCRSLKGDGFSGLKVFLTADLFRKEHQGAEINGDAPFENHLQSFAGIAFHVIAAQLTLRIGAATSVLASLVASNALVLRLANQDADRAVRFLTATNAAVWSRQSPTVVGEGQL